MTKEEKIAKLQEVELKQELYNEQYQEDFKAGLELLEEEWFMCSLNGKYRIINKRDIYIQMTDSDAMNTFANLFIIKKTAGLKEDIESIEYIYPKWKIQTKRFMGLDFDPHQKYGEIKNENGHIVWNTWKGWSVKAEKNGKAKVFLSHIYYNICKRNKQLYDVIIDAWATHIQMPWKHFPKIFAMKGPEGGGKTFAVEAFLYLLGQYGVTISSDVVESNFNSLFFQKCFLFADESCWVGSIRTQNRLKNTSGNKTIPITFKGKDTFIAKNYGHLWVSTNDKWVAPKNQDSRRYIVWRVGDKHLNDSKYFAKILKDLEDGGYEDLMYYLQNRVIKTNFWSKLPDFDKETSEEQELMTMEAQNPIKLWLIKCKNNEVDPIHNPLILKSKLKFIEIYPWYVEWSQNNNIHSIVSGPSFSQLLVKYVSNTIGANNHRIWDFSVVNL